MRVGQHPLVFISGKGGVGKSVIAAAYAHRLSQRGVKTLLVELSQPSFYSKFFNENIGQEPKELKSNFSVVSLDPALTLEGYIAHLIKVKKLAQIFFQNRPMQALINAAPSLKELSLIGQVTSHIRHYGPEMSYDCLVVDAYATGHFLSLLRAPFGMYEAIKMGPMGRQCQDMMRVLSDDTKTKIVTVGLPEESPTQELIELCNDIQLEFKQCPDIVLNQVFNELEYSPENSMFEQYCSDKVMSQKLCRNKLQVLSSKVHEIPFVPTLDSWHLVEELSSRLGGLC